MRDIAFAAFMAGLLPFILKRPWLGMLAFAWLSLMNPYRFAFGFAYDAPWVQIVALVTLVSLALHHQREDWDYRFGAIFALLMLLPLWTCVTTIFAFEREKAFGRLEEVLKVFLFVHVAAGVLCTRQRIDWLVWVIVVSVGFYGFKGGIFVLLTAGEAKVWGPPGKSYLSDNNAIAIAMIMVVPLMHYLRGIATSPWIRRGLLAAMVLSSIAVIGTYSRGGFLAVAAMLLFLWLKSRQKLLLSVLFVALIPIGLTSMPERWFERMGTISNYEEDSSAMGRINTWTTAINIANDRPLVGGGFELYTPNTFARYAPNPLAVHSAHSIYFQILGEHGYVGLLIFLSIGVSTWIVARRTIAAVRDRDDLAWAGQLARAIQVSLVGYAVGGTFINIGYWDLIYYEIVIAVIVHRIVLEARLVDPARVVPAASLPKMHSRAAGTP